MAWFLPADPRLPLRSVEPANGSDFHLAQLYDLLTCDTIEVLPLADGRIMVLDEEGKFTEKPRNERATQLAGFATPAQLAAELLRMREAGVAVHWVGDPLTDLMTETDWIVGDVLICNEDELR